MILDSLDVPIVLAPLAGGPSTAELAGAVAGAGGLGFVAAGYLSAQECRQRIDRARSLSTGHIGVNVFVPGAGAVDPAVYRPYLDKLESWSSHRGASLGEPRYSDDDFAAKIDLLERERVPVVSFTFGCPSHEVVDRLHAAESEVWVTVTSPAEATQAEAAGADVLVVQGAEAGGHRASFTDRPDLPVYGLLALLSLTRAASSLPLVASGGIATGAALAAVLCAGATAGQIGTAFMLCPEAGTSEVHRAALRTDDETELTRAFTGRLARGIRNQFMAQHGEGAPVAYPELHYVTAPMRKRAREQGDRELVNLWAGEAHALAHEAPAAQIVSELATECRAALEAVSDRLSQQRRQPKP
jgi:nitronate monooxygenase